MKNLIETFNSVDYFVVAHRGASGIAPENTLSSFAEAIRSGAHFIEMDIQVTADGMPIVFHDKGLSRTTDGIGFASKLTYEELLKFDSGNWFSSEFSGERIPSLQRVLEFVQNQILINIELKNLGPSPQQHIQKILQIIEQYDYSDKIVISSFYYEQLKIVKELNGQIPTALIRLPKDKRLPSVLAREYHCQGFVCSLEELNWEITKDACDNNLFVGVYTINTPEELEYALQFDIKAIVTNYPAQILSLLKEKYKARV